MMLKVGDKVKVKEDLVVWKKYGILTLYPHMAEYLGKTLTVKGSDGEIFEVDENVYYWDELMVEKVATIEPSTKSKKIKLYEFNEGDRVVCINKPENDTDLILGNIYTIKGASTLPSGDIVFAIEDKNGSTIYSIGENLLIYDMAFENTDFLFNEYYDWDEDFDADMDETWNNKSFPSIYEIRALGEEYCHTDGSAHYKGGDTEIEPIEFAIQNGLFEDFAIVNMIKYASRFKKDKNLDDLKKVADYAHILTGMYLKQEGLNEEF